MRKVTALISVAALFLSGVTIGALAMHLYAERQPPAHGMGFGPPGPPKGGPKGPFGMSRMQLHLADELALTEQQSDQLREILDDTRRRGDQLRREVRPKLDELMEQTDSRISAILTSEQRERFEELRKERSPLRRFLLGRGFGGPRDRRPPPDGN